MRILLVLVLMIQALGAEEKRVVIITGASRGVGLATAELLSTNGYSVYGTVRGKCAVPENENLHFIEVDLKDEGSVHDAVQDVIKKEGRVDILINNAGYAAVGPVEMFTAKEMHEQMDINFFAPIKFIQAVLPWMRNRKSGHIINISSTNAIVTPPFGSLYAASKAALESLSESLCVEVRPFNIGVSIIECGLLSTQFTLLMGTKVIEGDPYQDVTDALKVGLEERKGYAEAMGQSPKEIAEFLLRVIEDSRPKLRYQSSVNARQDVSLKLLDLTGDTYLEKIGGFRD